MSRSCDFPDRNAWCDREFIVVGFMVILRTRLIAESRQLLFSKESSTVSEYTEQNSNVSVAPTFYRVTDASGRIVLVGITIFSLVLTPLTPTTTLRRTAHVFLVSINWLVVNIILLI